MNFHPTKITLAFLVFCMPLFALGQVSGIQNDADDNENDRNSGSNSSSSSSSSGSTWDNDDNYNSYDDDGDGIGGECMAYACSGCISSIDWGAVCVGTGQLFVLNQENINDRKSVVPWIAGVELMHHTGYSTREKTVWQKPEIRLHYGALNMQYRFTSLEDNTGNYNTSDWQFLVFDLVNSENFTGSIGNGIMHEYYSGNTYYELTTGFELHFVQHKYNAAVEYRHAMDGKTSAVPRNEFSLRFDYKLFSKNIFHFHLSSSYTFQRYYGNTDFNLLSAGINVGIY